MVKVQTETDGDHGAKLSIKKLDPTYNHALFVYVWVRYIIFFATVLRQRNWIETKLLYVSSFGIVLVSIRRWVTSRVDGKQITTNQNKYLEKGAG